MGMVTEREKEYLMTDMVAVRRLGHGLGVAGKEELRTQRTGLGS